jgi:hypothetical protein
MPKRETRQRKACCLISELLEDSGLDREHVRRLRRQVLEGIVMLCQWQLQRLADEETPPPRSPRSRKVPVE